MSETTQWEYRVKSFGSFFQGVRDDLLEAELNQWGEEGWEVTGLSYDREHQSVSADRQTSSHPGYPPAAVHAVNARSRRDLLMNSTIIGGCIWMVYQNYSNTSPTLSRC